jgi:hypothetical protein
MRYHAASRKNIAGKFRWQTFSTQSGRKQSSARDEEPGGGLWVRLPFGLRTLSQ